MKAGNLTKTRFLSGYQCEKKLWFEINKTVEPVPYGPADLLRFERGKAVDKRAQDCFPSSKEVDTLDQELAVKQTRQAMESSAPAILQAALYYEGFLVRVDVLERVGSDSWNIVEVKMSSKVKPEQIIDAAFQLHVATLCGLKINQCFIMHLNRESKYPDLERLFTKTDITQKADDLLKRLRSDINRVGSILSAQSEPEVQVGKHCNNPYKCSFQGHCWKDVPTHSVFTIPRVGEKKLNQLLDLGIKEISDVPSDFELTDPQGEYVELVKSGKPKIDKKAIKAQLAGLSYPLYFLDFETDAPPIPRLERMHPYDKIPFQYSLHILSEDGELEHLEFLHMDDSDPREAISKRLATDIGDSGTVIAYYASFERGVLESLAEFSECYGEKLLSIRDRLWDQLDIFRDHYKHPSFVGSNSIKVVLDKLIPGLSHKDIAISGGDDAAALWVSMIKSEDARERSKLEGDLKEYCRLDTLAMVEIHKHLERL